MTSYMWEKSKNKYIQIFNTSCQLVFFLKVGITYAKNLISTQYTNNIETFLISGVTTSFILNDQENKDAMIPK